MRGPLDAENWWNSLVESDRALLLYHSGVPEFQVVAVNFSRRLFSGLPDIAKDVVGRTYELNKQGGVYWFGVTVSFNCPLCGKDSLEKAAIGSPTGNPQEINSFILHQKIFCQHCNQLSPKGTDLHADVHQGTYEELKTLGYLMPAPGE